MIDTKLSLTMKKNSAVLSADLTKELLDEKLMQKYGTSLDINMGREYQKYLDNKYRQLRDEFEKINKDQNDDINIDELTDFLNTYYDETGRKYDHDYVKKLFNLIDKDHNELLSIQEFVGSYIKLEERLRLKKISLSKLDDELKIVREKYIKGLKENQDEILTKEGISKTAVLNISLLRAKNLKPMNFNGTSDSYVVVKLDNKIMKSKYIPGKLDPEWNEDFSFDIRKPKLVLEVQVWNRNTIGSDDLEGGVKIPLSDLDDQLKRIGDYDLELNGDTTGNGTITLRLQYLFSRRKFFEDNIKKTEMQIERLQEDINELNRLFELFQKPFGMLLYGEINYILESKILERSEDIETYAVPLRKSVLGSPRKTIGIAFRVEDMIKMTLKTSNIQWTKISLIMMYTIVISSCICLIERSDFVGLFVGVAIWTLFISGNKIDVLEYLKYLLFTILATIFYDLFWLFLHYSSYWKGASLESVEYGLKSFTYFLSFINFCAKIVLLISLWIQFSKAKVQQNYRENRNSINGEINNANLFAKKPNDTILTTNPIITIGESYHQN